MAAKRQEGFTLVELLITMTMFVLVIAAASDIFTGLLNRSKQQSKVSETNMEAMMGLDILRKDIGHAGYGLPWKIPAGVNYLEASTASAALYNDAPSSAPRAILSGNNTGYHGSDYIVIKAANLANNEVCRRWTYLRSGNVAREWEPEAARLPGGARVIVLSNSQSAEGRVLVAAGPSFFSRYERSSPDGLAQASFAPSDTAESRIVYGIDDDTNLRMPFNRADFFIRVPAGNMPRMCASGTGVLYKAILSHTAGTFPAGNMVPLLDCVADLQVVFGLDVNNDGNIIYTDDISDGVLFSAPRIRDQVREVRVYVLAHEGQRDVNYLYPAGEITMPAAPDPAAGLGSTFNLEAIPDYRNYRWKVYTLVVKPDNLR
ncbi:MAG: prepilin-type N-terminal cleavage/methylation domain-containing protein [Nitrospirae bacterium]|nr:prepilin-type N-terminal cleavage/methylation domain-containing protein [Nitrospirota bacterium]